MQTRGRFTLLGRLYSVGRAALYEAYDPSLDRRVELLVLAADDATAHEVEAFGARASAWAAVQHPGVARVHEIGTDGLGVFVAVEAGRQTLESWCDGGSFERLLVMLDDALAGLSAVHEAGLVHGAIDDRGVLVSRQGRAKLSRFLLLRADDDAQESAQRSPQQDAAALCRSFAQCGARLAAPAWFAALLREGEADLDVARRALKRRIRGQPRWVSYGLVAGIALATAAVAWNESLAHQVDAAHLCPDDLDPLAEAWGDTRKAAIEAAIMATGRQGAAGKWQELEGRLDRWADEWMQARRQACHAVAGTDVQITARQATLACLDDRRMQLEIMSETFAAVNDASFGTVFGESRALPRPEDCVEGGAYRELLSPDTRDVLNEMAKAHALMLAQRIDEARAVYGRAGPRAESIGLFNAASEAYRFVALQAQNRGETTRANVLLQRALFTAEQSRDPVMLVRAWHRLAEQAGHAGDAERAEFFMARALARASDEAVAAETAMELLTFEAKRLSGQDRPAEAAERYIEAYEYIEEFGNHPLLGLQALFQASQALQSSGDRMRADALAETVVEEGTARYGPHHWIVAVAEAQLAQSALQARDFAQGLRWSTAALEVDLDHPMAFQAKGLATLMHADLLREHDRTEEGRALLAATLEDLGPRLKPWPQILVAMRAALARFATDLGRPCEAADTTGPLVAQIEANPLFSRRQLATELLNLANAQSKCGRAAQGLDSLERGLALIATLADTSPRFRFESRRRSGTIFKQLGQPARAIEAYEHALELSALVDVDPERIESIRSEIASLSRRRAPR